MSQAPIMPMATDAMIADTTHLSAEEFGAYHLILYATWRNNGEPLPDDDARLARVARMTAAKWAKMRPVLVKFFDTADGFWRQKRLEKEWSRVQKNVRKNRENGSRGGRPKSRKNNDTENPVGFSGETQNEPNGKAYHIHIHKDSITPPPSPVSARPPDPPIGGGPAERLAEKFAETRERLWPNDPSFGAPLTTLTTQAKGWLDAGLSEAEIADHLETACQRMAQQGLSAPGSFEAFRRSLQDRVARKRNARDAVVAAPKPVDERALAANGRRWTLQHFLDSGEWNPAMAAQWGLPEPKPTREWAAAELAKPVPVQRRAIGE